MESPTSPLTFPTAHAESPFGDLQAGHVAIRTTEYEALLKWYTEKLDFRLVREWNSGEMKLAFLALPNNNHFLMEVLGITGTEAADPEVKQGYDHLCFNIPHLDQTLEALQKRGIKIVRSFKAPAIGKRVAFIADPFGNKIEFCEDLK